MSEEFEVNDVTHDAINVRVRGMEIVLEATDRGLTITAYNTPNSKGYQNIIDALLVEWGDAEPIEED